jgi:hypothetical protein
MASRTFFRVFDDTEGWLLSTRETVWCETPAMAATSAMVGVARNVDMIEF